MRQPPGPKGLPIIGNLEAYEEDRLGFLTSCAREYGDVVRYNDQVYLVNGPELIERILTRTNREFHIPVNFLRQEVGEEKLGGWMQKRRAAGTGLHRSMILGYASRIVEITERILDTWVPGRSLIALRDLQQITSAVMADYCFGSDDPSIPVLAGDLLDALFALARSPFLFPFWFPTPTNVRARRRLHRLNQAMYRIIEQKRRSQMETMDLLSIMMHTPGQPGESFSDKDLCDTIVSILVAAHGVPAAALSWVWCLLAESPASACKFRGEIEQVLGDRLPEATDLPQLKYTECIVKEALRLYPPSWFTVRKVATDCELGGYPLVHGQKLVFSSYVVQRDPRFYEDPEQFLPERWLDENKVRSVPKYAYFPFNGGPRACLGTHLAMTELLLMTATIARRFWLRPKDGAKVTPDARGTLVPANLQLVVEPRVQVERLPG